MSRARCQASPAVFLRAWHHVAVNAPIPDGVYDAFVVDAHARDDDLALSLTITRGEKKGVVIDVLTARDAFDELSVIGTPCTLLVENGEPRVRF